MFGLGLQEVGIILLICLVLFGPLLVGAGIVIYLLKNKKPAPASSPLQEIQQHQAMSDKPIDPIIAEINFSGDREAMQRRAQEMGYGFADLDRVTVDSITLSILQKEVVERLRVLPVKQQDNTLWLAMANPTDNQAIEEVSNATGNRVIPVVAVPSAIDEAIAKYY